VTYTDSTVALDSTYVYRVAPDNVAGTSAWTAAVTVPVSRAAAPSILTAVAVRAGSQERVTLTWAPVPWGTGYVLQRSADPAFGSGVTSTTLGTVATYTTGNIATGLVLQDRRRQRARSVRLVRGADRAGSPVRHDPSAG
jgi:hypothetical protein